MKISTKGRYALRILLDLAEHRHEGYISLKTVAERQEISKRYLDQIVMLLNRNDYLKTTRGAQGGYKLAKSPEEYTVGDILRLTEGSISPVACVEDNGHECNRFADCAARQVWKGLEAVVANYLDGITLQDILDKYGKVPVDFSI